MAGLLPRGVSVSCQCACSDQVQPVTGSSGSAIGNPEVSLQGLPADGPDSLLSMAGPGEGGDSGQVDLDSPRRLSPPRPRNERGIASYIAELNMPLMGSPIRVGEVWHLHHEDAKSLEPATLSLYANGFEVRPDNGNDPITVSWSPFSLVQACRLHSVQADAALPWLRLFKVSVFHHGAAHHFAARNEDSEATMRARWVADVARALRMLTASLFPPFRIRSEPVTGAAWTSTRLVAGYLLMCDNQDVALVYCELHSHWDNVAAFAVYEDEYCDTRVMHVALGVHTCISERVGVDCSCFSIDGHHFSARSSAEKAFWLRAVSNVKVKLRHRAENPSNLELAHYRSSVAESARFIREPEPAAHALLPRREKETKAAGKSKGGYRQESPRGDDKDDTNSQGTAGTAGKTVASKIASLGGAVASRMLGGTKVQNPTAPTLPNERGQNLPNPSGQDIMDGASPASRTNTNSTLGDDEPPTPGTAADAAPAPATPLAEKPDPQSPDLGN